MYKIRWWFQNGQWECKVSRQIGWRYFNTTGYLPGTNPEIGACCRLERELIESIERSIVKEGGSV